MKNKFDCLIFDMDGVLVDVSRSYRKAIELTVNFYLTEKGNAGKISQKEVNRIKNQPGFNNDWDAAYRLVGLSKRDSKPDGILPLTEQERNSRIFRKLKRIFQNFYLGSQLYESIYGKKAGYIVGLGLIEKESLLIRKNLLLLLKRKYSLAIATGRPRPEALYTLRRFELETGFHADMVVAFEDAAYPKPSPDPLITAAGRAGGKNCVYIGDTISDIEAAERAGMFSVYIGKEKMGNLQLKNVNHLKEVFL